MAGLEASGTGNMKFTLNGALTIGTMDVQILKFVKKSAKRTFSSCLLADEVVKLKSGGYNPRTYYESNPMLKRVLDMIASNYFNKSEPGIFKSIVDSLLGVDYYCLLADYQSYIDEQEKVSKLYLNVDE